MKQTEIKEVVRDHYAKIGKQDISESRQDFLKKIGYTREELQAVPEGATGFGCGNPVALAFLREGETVLDLGSGAERAGNGAGRRRNGNRG